MIQSSVRTGTVGPRAVRWFMKLRGLSGRCAGGKKNTCRLMACLAKALSVEHRLTRRPGVVDFLNTIISNGALGKHGPGSW
jgi:hypothetical protein